MKRPLLKNSISIIILLLFFNLNAFGQDSWTLIKDESGVKIYYQIEKCESQKDIDPIDMMTSEDLSHDTFKLKVINNNVSSRSITFSKVTKMDNSDEMTSIIATNGTTLLETCSSAPKMMLTKQESDQFPISVNDFINAFIITIEN
jgi:hypothetical protein